VVARYLQTTDAAPSVVSIDTGGGKSSAPEIGSKGYANDAAPGVGKGGK
jgi:hypothetical protein